MHGGLKLPTHKQHLAASSIAPASIPERLTLSLPSNCHLRVQAGSAVMLGQPLADSDTVVMHAPVSGVVRTVQPTHAGINMEIANDGRDTLHPEIQPLSNYAKIEPLELRTRIAAAGILGLGGAAFATGSKLDAAAERGAKLLIVNGAECEPFIACDDALMREQSAEIILGVQALLRASGCTRAIIAVEQDKIEARKALERAMEDAVDERLQLHTLANIYPTGGENQLVTAITNEEVPTLGIPPDIAALCQNVGTAAAVGRLIATGQPMIDRVVTVTGHGVRTPRNLRARFGTPISSLVADCGGHQGAVVRLIMGGMMMGVALESDDYTVNAMTNCILLATSADLEPRSDELPCIRCGNCADVCPAQLLPQQLLRFARLEDRVALRELGLRDCIECGCCDYVCPSKIFITRELRAAKSFEAHAARS